MPCPGLARALGRRRENGQKRLPRRIRVLWDGLGGRDKARSFAPMQEPATIHDGTPRNWIRIGIIVGIGSDCPRSLRSSFASQIVLSRSCPARPVQVAALRLPGPQEAFNHLGLERSTSPPEAGRSLSAKSLFNETPAGIRIQH